MMALEFEFTEHVDGVSMSRILDRALQKLRKEGRIEFITRVGWRIMEKKQ